MYIPSLLEQFFSIDIKLLGKSLKLRLSLFLTFKASKLLTLKLKITNKLLANEA
jgi:hypothetical protein